MKLFNKTSVFIIFSAFLLFIIDELLSYNISLQNEKKTTYQNDKAIVRNLFSAQKEYLRSIAKILTADSIVIEAFEKNNPKILIQHIEPIWKILQEKQFVHEIHFFKPPALSFVNFSNFKSLGTNVADVRKDIVWVTTAFKESSHIFMCKTYAGYRATEPIFDNKKNILGALSLGEKIDWIPKILKERTTHDSFIIYTKKSTKTLSEKYYKNFMHNKQTIGDYILADQTLKISPDNIQNIDFNKKIQNITIDGKDYNLYMYPLIDFNKNTMGYLFTIKKSQILKDVFLQKTMKDTILIFITTIILLLITRRYTNLLLAYINKIKEMTENIKTRNFKFLHVEESDQDINHISLLELKENIISMGLSLEEQYNKLENENKSKTKQLIMQLYRDELTGLGNRNALIRDLVEYTDAHIAIYNARGFKNINDAFGFEAGNNILQAVGNMFSDTLNEKFIFYRMSNDEFVMINKVSLSKDDFIAITKEMIDKLETTTFQYQNIDITINIYVGICLHKEKRLEKASVALSKAKENKLSYYVYNGNEDTKEIQIANIDMLNKISYALHNDNIITYYQPIVDRNGTIKKYESLVRMINKNTVLSPYYFLDISKKTKLYTDISKVVIEKTFDAFKNSDKMFSINLTATDILNQEVVTLVFDKLAGIKNTRQVVFELVESDDLYNLKEIEYFLNDIKEKGAKIAIDDFGTGYSNFSYIIKMKPDYLKIDGSLIKNIDSDIFAYNSVKTIIHFAHELNVSVVAEFIHSQEIFEICKKLGVDEFQGYYFGEPNNTII